MRKVLVIYYSQSGQLGDIISHLTEPMITAGHSVEIINIQPEKAYPFPWTGKSFFAVMPDSVQEVPTALKPFDLKEQSYDLVIIGYQAWFLSPSIPSNSFLNQPQVKSVLNGTPVVTITGVRNMWISAMQRIKVYLNNANATLQGHIVLRDKHANIVSFVTILYWMFTGKRDKYLNIFPKPGVADEDIKNCTIYGRIIENHLISGDWHGMQQELVDKKAVEVKYNLMFIESKAKRIFRLWANFIIKRKKRTGWLVAFKYYLIIALFVAAPIILTVDAIFFKPFLSARIKKQKQTYLGLNK
jgi:hypothetical protein